MYNSHNKYKFLDTVLCNTDTDIEQIEIKIKSESKYRTKLIKDYLNLYQSKQIIKRTINHINSLDKKCNTQSLFIKNVGTIQTHECGTILIVYSVDILFSRLSAINKLLTLERSLIIQTTSECKKILENIYDYPWISYISFYSCLSIKDMPKIYLENLQHDNLYDFTPIKYICNSSHILVNQLSFIKETFYTTGRKGELYIDTTDNILKNLEILDHQPYISIYRKYENDIFDIDLRNQIIESGKHKWLYTRKIKEWANKIIIDSTVFDINYLKNLYGLDIVFLHINNSDTDTDNIRDIKITHYFADFSECCSIIGSCKLYIGNNPYLLSISRALHIENICLSDNIVFPFSRLTIQNPINDIPIFIVHYKNLTERKEYLDSSLKNNGFTNIKWFDSIVRDSLSHIHMDRYIKTEHLWNKIKFVVSPHYGGEYRELTLPEIAVCNTHLEIYKYMIDNNIEKAIIMEDDCILYDSFKYTLQHILKELPTNFDACHVSDYNDWEWSIDIYKNINDIENTEPLTENKYVYKMCASKTADAYILSNKGASILYYKMASFCCPIDWQLGYIYKTENMEVYWSEPYLTLQGSFFKYKSEAGVNRAF